MHLSFVQIAMKFKVSTSESYPINLIAHISWTSKSVVDNGDVVDNQQLSRGMRYFSTAVRTDYLQFGNPDIQRFIFGGEGKVPSNVS